MCFIVTLNFGCKKFSVSKNESQPSIPAGVDNLNKTIAQFLSENNFHDSDLTAINYFAKAIQRVGLLSKLDSSINYTVIVPSDTAMVVFFRGLGYQNIDNVPTSILKNFLEGDIFAGKVNSFDLNIGDTKRYPSLNGDYIYMTRQTSTSDAYLLTINNNDSLSTPPIGVRTQNIDLKNGVIHVVDAFTYYALKKATPDPVDTSKIQIISDTVAVTQDAYVTYGSNAKKNYNLVYLWAKKNSSPNSTRRTLLQFDITQPSFTGKIGFAKLFLYNYRADGSSAASLNIYKDASDNWDENTLTAKNEPTEGTSIVGSFSVNPNHLDMYVSADITAMYSAALSNNEPFINLGIETTANAIAGFYSKEYDSARFAPFIVITSPPKSVITSVKVNNPIKVNGQSGYKVLSLSDIVSTGTENKNIIYVVKQLPTNGYLVFYGIPLKLNATFTQADLANGAIKYLYNGTGNGDQAELQAKDFQGGYYPDLLNVNFQIQ